MQVSIYVTADDYEQLAKNKPQDRSVPQHMTDIIKDKAEFYRKIVSKDGNPIIPQYVRQ